MEIDTSLKSWIFNTHTVIKSPLTILSVIGLIIAGAFAEIAPRKSLEFLDTTFGSILFFAIPLSISYFLDWATGLLATVVSLIIFTRLQKQDVSEGFIDDLSMTELIPSPKRWFVEKVLGETPIAISSDRVSSSQMKDTDSRTSSSSSMSSSETSDGSSSHMAK
jgi:hypothetical protein